MSEFEDINIDDMLKGITPNFEDNHIEYKGPTDIYGR